MGSFNGALRQGTNPTVESTVEVQGSGDLELMAPIVEMMPGFNVHTSGKLSITSQDPMATDP